MQWHLLGLINRGMNEEARQDLETNIRSSDKSEWTIEAKLTWVTGEPRGARDVIRLRNPTFRRMLTSADPWGRGWPVFWRFWREFVFQNSDNFTAHSCDFWRKGEEKYFAKNRQEWSKSYIKFTASYVHPKNSNHLRSHLRAIMGRLLITVD